jgi:hypothetical protein
MTELIREDQLGSYFLRIPLLFDAREDDKLYPDCRQKNFEAEFRDVPISATDGSIISFPAGRMSSVSTVPSADHEIRVFELEP